MTRPGTEPKSLWPLVNSLPISPMCRSKPIDIKIMDTISQLSFLCFQKSSDDQDCQKIVKNT